MEFIIIPEIFGLAFTPIFIWFGAIAITLSNLGKSANLAMTTTQGLLIISICILIVFEIPNSIEPATLIIKMFLLVFGIELLKFIKKTLEIDISYYEIGPLMLIALGTLIAIFDSFDLFNLYLIVELQSLTLFILIALKRRSILSIEASLKYLFMSGLASSFYLYGTSIVYGLFGTTNLLYLSFFANTYIAALLEITALTLIIVALLTKLTIAPFHLWAPDVYQAAPMFVTNYIATAAKIAFYIMTIRLLFLVTNWVPWSVIALFAIISVVIGSIGALYQTDLRRFMAYSGVAHLGLLFTSLTQNSLVSVEATLVYILFYFLTGATVFLIITTLSIEKGEHTVKTTKLEDLVGLSIQNPFMAGLLAINMLSMAGIPPLGGFYGKSFILLTLIEEEQWVLIIIIIAMLLLSSYYYLRVIKAMYFEKVAYRMNESRKRSILTFFTVIATMINMIAIAYIGDILILARALLIERI
jgi:NADH-quinone oxidoreductase subunit N